MVRQSARDKAENRATSEGRAAFPILRKETAMRWVALVTCGPVVLLPAPIRAHPHPDAPASAISHGLRITLDVPRRSYPRDALILVTLSIRNTSRHAISIMSGLNAPRVVLLAASGQEVYDPGTPLGGLTLAPPTGPGPESVRLLSQKSWTAHEYVVLRGTTLEARVILGDVRSSSQEVSIDRPRLALRRTREPAPQVLLSFPPLKARLNPPSPQSTPLVSVSQTQCDNMITGGGWVAAARRILVPDVGAACRPGIWHAIAGWLNHPVATIAYRATPKVITISTTPPPKPQPPDANSPAAGICGRAQGPVFSVQMDVDTPLPRCEVVKPGQRLEVVNALDRSTVVRLAHFTARLPPGEVLRIDQPFGAYLARGVHVLAISAYGGGGAELWLQT